MKDDERIGCPCVHASKTLQFQQAFCHSFTEVGQATLLIVYDLGFTMDLNLRERGGFQITMAGFCPWTGSFFPHILMIEAGTASADHRDWNS